MIIAFFDLDRTLVRQNTALLYARFERQNKRISWRQWLSSGLWVGLYHLNILDIDRAYQKATQHYRGIPEQEIRDRTWHFFEHFVEHLLLAPAKERLRYHKQQGHCCVLITNGSCFQAQIAQEKWGLDHWLATEFEIDQGRLTGRAKTPLCYGQGKLIQASSFAESKQASLAQSYFYTDSYSDLPLLAAVGHPVVVNPDPKLKRYALRQPWQVETWQ